LEAVVCTGGGGGSGAWGRACVAHCTLQLTVSSSCCRISTTVCPPPPPTPTQSVRPRVHLFNHAESVRTHLHLAVDRQFLVLQDLNDRLPRQARHIRRVQRGHACVGCPVVPLEHPANRDPIIRPCLPGHKEALFKSCKRVALAEPLVGTHGS
jgi:hypothetical protein